MPNLFVSTKICHSLTVTTLLMTMMMARMLMMTTGDIKNLAIVIKMHQLFSFQFSKESDLPFD